MKLLVELSPHELKVAIEDFLRRKGFESATTIYDLNKSLTVEICKPIGSTGVEYVGNFISNDRPA